MNELKLTNFPNKRPQFYISIVNQQKSKFSLFGLGYILFFANKINPFPNNKFKILPISQSLQTTISDLMKMAESSPNS